MFITCHRHWIRWREASLMKSSASSPLIKWLGAAQASPVEFHLFPRSLSLLSVFSLLLAFFIQVLFKLPFDNISTKVEHGHPRHTTSVSVHIPATCEMRSGGGDFPNRRAFVVRRVAAASPAARRGPASPAALFPLTTISSPAIMLVVYARCHACHRFAGLFHTLEQPCRGSAF